MIPVLHQGYEPPGAARMIFACVEQVVGAVRSNGEKSISAACFGSSKRHYVAPVKRDFDTFVCAHTWKWMAP